MIETKVQYLYNIIADTLNWPRDAFHHIEYYHDGAFARSQDDYVCEAIISHHALNVKITLFEANTAITMRLNKAMKYNSRHFPIMPYQKTEFSETDYTNHDYISNTLKNMLIVMTSHPAWSK